MAVSLALGWIEGRPHIRSKGQEMVFDAPDKMFRLAASTVGEKFTQGLLHPEWTYRCEYLQKPKHNTLEYNRVPTGHIILFDINTGDQEFLSYDDKAAEAKRIGLEVVPRLYQGHVTDLDGFQRLLESESVLVGQKIEGVVVKPVNYDLWGRDHKVLMGKYVSERFKEVHKSEWKVSNPGGKDVVQALGEKYAHEGRWQKAVQHLRDAGQLENDPRDIGKLLIEVMKDLGTEEKDAIKQALWKWAWPQISRISTRGLAEWYKQQLLASAFEGEGRMDASIDSSASASGVSGVGDFDRGVGGGE